MSKITFEILHEFLTYDPFTGNMYWKFRDRKWFESDRIWKSWNSKHAGKEAFTAIIKDSGYNQGTILGEKVLKHRVIWFMMFGYWPIEVDHQNGERTNNKLLNLRDVTASENNKNKLQQSNNTTGVTGVHFNKNAKKYQVRITDQYGKHIHVGYYSDFDEAVQVRKLKEIEHGYHANHGRLRNA